MDTIDRVIRIVDECHEIFTTDWEKNRTEKFNYKRKIVKDIVNDTDLLTNVLQYRALLNKRIIELTGLFERLERLESCKCKINTRVKTLNSIEQKINVYNTNELKGEVPINKCLNDLYGIRIILNDDIELGEILSHIMVKFPNLKCKNSSKNGYKAVHVYFSKDNYDLPWELQIWNSSDESKNIELHKEYKQAYTKWENNYNEGGEMV